MGWSDLIMFTHLLSVFQSPVIRSSRSSIAATSANSSSRKTAVAAGQIGKQHTFTVLANRFVNPHFLDTHGSLLYPGIVR